MHDDRGALPDPAGDPVAQGAGAEPAVGGDRRRGEARARRGGAGRVGDGAAAGGRAGAGSALRAVAWNVMRGARLDDLRRTVVSPPFAGTDVLLLSEVDVGVGRSGNRNVARELAEVLGMSYAFGVSYLALTDDIGDDAAGLENTLALSGAAVLSRYPIGRVENIDLPRSRTSSTRRRNGSARSAPCWRRSRFPMAARGGRLPPRLDRLARAARAPARWDPRQRRSLRRGARAGGRRFQHQHLRRLEHAGAGARHLPQAAGQRDSAPPSTST